MPTCRKCGAEIVWGTTKNGRPTPVNPDGETHWATCPGAAAIKEEYREKRKEK